MKNRSFHQSTVDFRFNLTINNTFEKFKCWFKRDSSLSSSCEFPFGPCSLPPGRPGSPCLPLHHQLPQRGPHNSHTHLHHLLPDCCTTPGTPKPLVQLVSDSGFLCIYLSPSHSMQTCHQTVHLTSTS